MESSSANTTENNTRHITIGIYTFLNDISGFNKGEKRVFVHANKMRVVPAGERMEGIVLKLVITSALR